MHAGVFSCISSWPSLFSQEELKLQIPAFLVLLAVSDHAWQPLLCLQNAGTCCINSSSQNRLSQEEFYSDVHSIHFVLGNREKTLKWALCCPWPPLYLIYLLHLHKVRLGNLGSRMLQKERFMAGRRLMGSPRRSLIFPSSPWGTSVRVCHPGAVGNLHLENEGIARGLNLTYP